MPSPRIYVGWMVEYKQTIVVRDDIDMSEGKRIAQACHASLGAYERADEQVRNEWRTQGQKKVVLVAEDKDELMELYREAEAEHLPCHLVKDAGRTELEAGTITCFAVGPADADSVDRVTGGLDTV